MNKVKKIMLPIVGIMIFTIGVIIISTRANASCTIKKGDKILFTCKGETEKCDTSKFGYTLECSGKLAGKEGESSGTE